MLDIKLIRNHPDIVKKAITLKNSHIDVDELLALDEERRKKIAEVEELKHLKKTEGKNIAEAKRKGENASEAIAQMTKIAERTKILDKEIAECEEKLNSLMLWLPNIPEDDIPEGDESHNQHLRSWGTPKTFDFSPKPHWELCESLDIMDVEKAGRITGSGFSLLKGMGARLERALINFMLDVQTQEHGYLEISPAHLVSRNSATNSGQLPKLEEDMYVTKADDLFLIPTGEVPLINLFQNEIFSSEQLPIYVTAATSCFRREAGAAGKDTRGLLRVHEFKKVEMIKFVEQEHSRDELEKMVANAETILQRLEIPYRVILLAAGDMSFASCRTYDLEIWAPGVDRWLEVSSCSNCKDFQMRRANIRYKKGGKPRFVHALNGSGLAVPRLLVALLENYQRADGHIDIPGVLQPYLHNINEI